jgi:hypothetical protein
MNYSHTIIQIQQLFLLFSNRTSTETFWTPRVYVLSRSGFVLDHLCNVRNLNNISNSFRFSKPFFFSVGTRHRVMKNLLLPFFIETHRKRKVAKISWLDSKPFRNDSNSTRLEKWLDSPSPEIYWSNTVCNCRVNAKKKILTLKKLCFSVKIFWMNLTN